MKAARLHGTRDIRLDEVPPPTAVAEECLVRVEAVGVCGSDLHWFGEGSIGDAQLDRPLVLGHEMGGRIVDGPRAGELVAIDPAIPCWRCEQCRQGEVNVCANLRFAGHGPTDGGLRELMAWPSARLHPLPDAFTAVDAALLEPLGVGIHAMDLAEVPLGGTVAVVGCGPIGLLITQLARLAGARWIVAVDPLAHRRDRAADLGADVAADPATAAAAALEGTAGQGVDVAIEIAGPDTAVAVAVDSVRPAGRVVLAGIPDDDRTAFSASAARRKALTFVLARRMKEVYPRAVDLVARGAIDLSAIVSSRYPLSDVVEAMSAAEERRGHKVMILP